MKKKFKISPEINFFDIDPLKFRGRGFFKKIEQDKKNYLKKFSFLISNKKLNCPLCKNRNNSVFLRGKTLKFCIIDNFFIKKI